MVNIEYFNLTLGLFIRHIFYAILNEHIFTSWLLI